MRQKHHARALCGDEVLGRQATAQARPPFPHPHSPNPTYRARARGRCLLAAELVERALRLRALALQPRALGRQVPGALAVAFDVAGQGVLRAGQLAQALEGVQLSPEDGVALLERAGPLHVGGHALAEALQRRQAGHRHPALHQAVGLGGARRLLGMLILLLAGLEDVAAPVHGSCAGERARSRLPEAVRLGGRQLNKHRGPPAAAGTFQS